MSDVSTPLHPEAVHRHSVTKADGGCICYGWDDAGNRYKIWVCACGTPFFFEPD